MLLAIDIGNSNIVLALHDGAEWKHIFRFPTLSDESSLFYKMKIVNDFWEANIIPNQIKKCVLSSVVPILRDVFEEILLELFGKPPIVVNSTIFPKLKLEIDQPDEIGTDLVANAIAANQLFKKDCIVVDFGTALTFTVVSKEGHLKGVNIVPGLETAIQSLVGNTAQLPEVPLEMPKSAIGKNTVTAIQAGILIGYVGLVRHQLASIRAEVGEQYIAVATGGLSKILAELENDFEEVNMDLTMEGLRLIGETV
ncbi:MAG: type III pantothenate kinase [Saprospiraceae bacterium]